MYKKKGSSFLNFLSFPEINGNLVFVPFLYHFLHKG
jgi:hypothetical protein